VTGDASTVEADGWLGRVGSVVSARSAVSTALQPSMRSTYLRSARVGASRAIPALETRRDKPRWRFVLPFAQLAQPNGRMG
jgi:hypothetical protein